MKNKFIKNRYFFISYECRNNNGVSFGNLYFKCDRFPPNKFLKQLVFKKFDKNKYSFKIDDIIIMNIFEFKCKEDFDSFQDENYKVNEIKFNL